MTVGREQHGGRIRDLGAIILALTLVQMAVAGVGLFVPLLLAGQGESSFVIGIVTAAYMLGFLVGGRLAPGRIGLIGHIRAFVLFAALAAIGCLLFHLAASALWIALVELLIGFGVASLFATGESWIADAAPENRRGRVISAYYLIAKIGVMAGPMAVSATTVETGGVYMLLAGLFCLAILPVAATEQVQPDLPSTEPFGIVALWHAAPAAVQAAFVAGVVNGAVLQLYPLYVGAVLPENGLFAIAAFNAVAQIGALAMQWPAGVVSDRIDRRKVIGRLALVGALASGALAMFGEELGLIPVLGLAALWGMGSLTYYGIAVAHAADRAGPGQAAKAIGGMLIIWASGAVAGPIVAGALMSAALGPAGLFWLSAGALGLLAGAMFVRRVTDHGAPPEKEPFAPVSATSVGFAEIDPRV